MAAICFVEGKVLSNCTFKDRFMNRLEKLMSVRSKYSVGPNCLLFWYAVLGLAKSLSCILYLPSSFFFFLGSIISIMYY